MQASREVRFRGDERRAAERFQGLEARRFDSLKVERRRLAQQFRNPVVHQKLLTLLPLCERFLESREFLLEQFDLARPDFVTNFEVALDQRAEVFHLRLIASGFLRRAVAVAPKLRFLVKQLSERLVPLLQRRQRRRTVRSRTSA
jgi:hypothetical protein